MDIRGLGYVTAESTDLEQWRQYGTQVLGMMLAEDSDANTLYCYRTGLLWQVIASYDHGLFSFIRFKGEGESSSVSRKTFDQSIGELVNGFLPFSTTALTRTSYSR